MKKILSLILAIAFILSGSNLMFVTSFANQSETTIPEINVWLIAGQSNGEGYGQWANYPTDSIYAADKAFLEAGADNVLYMGRGDTSFTKVKPKETRTGAEIGIATSDVGRNEKNAVIKVALGNTYLYEDTVQTNSKNYGTWTPPTYIKNHNIDTSDNNIGGLYNAFIDKIEYGISELISLGYAPKIKGIWYMQGEAETLNSATYQSKPSDAYEELLTTLISDLRSDITKVTGVDYSTLPFLYGRIYRNPGTDPSTGALYTAATPYLSNIQAAQDAVAAKNITNVRMINTTTDLLDPVTGAKHTPTQQDGWHYDSLTQQAIGEKIVSTVQSLNYSSPTVTNTLIKYVAQTKNRLKDDGYIGIPVDITAYYDESKGNIKSGYNGTPIILYVTNTNTTRVGTASDESIILSMLNRGYVVLNIDYLNNEKATGQALDWSVQGLLQKTISKELLTDPVFPSGNYNDSYVVPSGYDISLNNVYWEYDKHASDGSLELILNNWNTDFKGVKGEKLLKWVYNDGTRKPVANAKDGTSPVWYNAEGTVDTNGEYTKVKYTAPTKITELVKPDGTPVQLEQEMNIIYPVNPSSKVPVLCIASSSEYLANTPQVKDRAHLTGALFRGYAGVVYDYAFFPMLYNDAYGTYNGSTSTYPNAVTNDSDNYSVHMYNNKRVTTAAMRFIRYKALSEPDTFKLDTDNIGIIGNSKGGAMSFLGEKIVQSPLIENPSSYATTEALESAIDEKINSFISRRAHPDHHNETRYQNGITQSYTDELTGVTIDGGEKQPWLTYNGKEIISGAQLIWASNGVNEEDISEGHSPQIVMNHFNDPWHYYGPINYMANICYSHNIPALVMEVPLAHTVAWGPDMNYNIDSYDTAFDFMGYWLKDEPVKVLWTDPQNGYGNIGVTDPITVKFSGSVSGSEITKVTVSDENGNNITGTWKSIYGNTEWMFTPDVLKGSTLYTITVPADLKGDNNVAIGNKYTALVYTKKDINTAASASYTTSKGTYFTLTAPNSTDASNLKVRFRVTNDAANVAALYAVTNFNSSSPDSSTVGELIGKVNLNGTGYYEIDASEYLLKNKGNDVTFLLKQDKEAGNTTTFASSFPNSSGYSKQSTTNMSFVNAPDGTASMKLYQTDTGTKHLNGQHKYYNNRGVKAVTVNNILGKSLTEDDYGRKFKISVKVYDTISRWFQLQLNTNSNASNQTVDYKNSMYNYMTKANDWSTFTFDYTVYDTDFGEIAFRNKNLIIGISHTGNSEIPLYIGEIKVEEIVTDIEADNFSLSSNYDNAVILKDAQSDKAFFLYDANGNKVSEHDGWNDALSAYKYGYTLKLMKNYTLTDDDLWSNFGTLEGANGDNGHIYNIDLNGYTISSLNSKNSLFWLKNISKNIEKTVINVKNGGILLKNTPLISYESSTTSGSGKKFDVNLTNINIGFLDNAMMDTIISNNTVASGAETTVDINLSECKIDLPDSKHTTEYKTIFPSGSADLTLNYNITGGSLNLTSLRWITIKNDLASSNFYKGADSKYTKLTLSNNAFTPEISCMLEGSSVAPYKYKSTTNNVASYELELDLLSTRYGVIPKEYEDVDSYPFVLFNESGTFIGASTEFFGNTSTSSIVDMARVYLKDNVYNTTNKNYGTAPKSAFVVMRKDYTLGTAERHGNLAQLQGVLTIDLNGHTLTQNSGYPLIDSTAKGWSYSGDAKIFPSEIKFENGKILLNNKGLVNFIAWDSAGDGSVSGKEFTHTYNDVTFGLVEGATVSSLFTYGTHASTPNATANFNVNITDCKFDFETVKPTSKITLFSAGSSTLTNNIVITGSEIYADSMTNVAISSVIKGSVTAKKNVDGELLKVYVTNANKGTFTSSKIATEYGEADFVELASVDGYAVYTLEDLEEDIPVPAHITSVTVTRYNSSFEMETSDVDTDLLNDGSATTPTATSSQIEYKNSTTVANNNLDKDENAGQHWLITLNDVCKVDSLTAVYTHTQKWVDFNVKVSKDNLTWTDLGTIRPDVASSKDIPVTIPLSSNECKYIKLSVVKRNATTVDDETVAWGANLGAGCTVALYELSVNEASDEEVDNSIVTPYGIIPSEYADINAHPWVWFDEGGNFKGSATYLYGWNKDDSIVGQAKVYMAGNTYNSTTQSYGDNEKAGYILLRKDYTMANEIYGNMSQIQGTLTIDLNGFKLSQGTNTAYPIVRSEIKPWSVTGDSALFPTEMYFKNGTIALMKVGLGDFRTFTSAGTSYTDLTAKKFTHTYEDITFMLTQSATVTDLFTVTDSSHTANAYVNMIDCKFDFETNKPAQQIRLFNANGTKIDVNFNITGSEIYADSMANITLSNIQNESSLTFEKDSDGLYLKVYVNDENKSTFTETKANTDAGEKEFVECAKTGNYALYILGYKEEPINENGTLNYFDQVFAAVDSFTLSNGTTYQGPVGVIFATSLEKVGDYKRSEYGVIISEKELSIDEFKTDKNAVWAKGLKINSKNQYGIRFYGSKIKTGNTYYTLPYAKYINSMGTEVTIYGTKVLKFIPVNN